MNTIIIDLETIKTTNKEHIDYIIKHTKPHHACKTDDAKEKSILKQIPEVIEKTVFDGTYGEIITIGYAINDEPINSFQRDKNINEVDILQAFFDVLNDVAKAEHKAPQYLNLKWIAHNKEFDFRFLYQRCVINNINTYGINIPVNDKHGTKYAYCTMQAWKGFGSKPGGSLDSIANVLNIPGKNDIDGSMVFGMWEEEKYKDIATYCESDVFITREIYKRLTFKKNITPSSINQ